VLITFSGLDGAGKSTLIAYLQHELERVHRPSVVCHMNDHVGLYAYLRMARNRLVGASPNPAPSEWTVVRAREARESGVRRSRSQRARSAIVRLRNRLVWSKRVRRLLYPLDLLVFLGYRAYVERLRGRVLVMDRYFYDTLVDVADGKRWRWLRVLERMTPEPDVALYLDIDPETAFARKGEYSVEYLQRRRGLYRTVFPWVPSHVALPATDLETMQATLRQIVLARIDAA
jgi:thymidylate kinase